MSNHWKKKNFRPYPEAREWARNSEIWTKVEWQLAYQRGELPDDIPGTPQHVYDEFQGFVDWLDSIADFEEGREWARNSDIYSSEEWIAAARTGKLPSNIPHHPPKIQKYKDKWISWRDWLESRWATYEEVQAWAQDSHLTTRRGWVEAHMRGELPEKFPCRPDRIYKEWTNTYDFFGKKKKNSLSDHALYIVNTWIKETWPYATAGKIEVCEMFQSRLLDLGYFDLRFLSLPGNGREIKHLLDEGFDLEYPNCRGVERNRAKQLFESIKHLFRTGKLGGIIPIIRADIDKLVLNQTDHILPVFNAVHLDYNGPLTKSHIFAVEAALRDNPDAVVMVTVQRKDQYKHRDIPYTPGIFPFENMNPELLFWQPYAGIKGCIMDTYCFRMRKPQY